MTEKCHVHGGELQELTAQPVYGLPMGPPAGYDKASDELFPFSRTHQLQGCTITDDPEPPIMVLACTECREAEQRWEKETGSSRWNSNNKIFSQNLFSLLH